MLIIKYGVCFGICFAAVDPGLDQDVDPGLDQDVDPGFGVACLSLPGGVSFSVRSLLSVWW